MQSPKPGNPGLSNSNLILASIGVGTELPEALVAPVGVCTGRRCGERAPMPDHFLCGRFGVLQRHRPVDQASGRFEDVDLSRTRTNSFQLLQMMEPL
ncbi:hypothetical protein FHY29_003728 [Xanthomonas arboricola]|uniref:hypothetical protein n=1 Tax=Xanthomonas arboricola TaxID=56448 RepID=UPI0011B04466|nr:hypothetical protein [Xanthomonas arboricola]